jgi:hypothetical protein
MLTHTRPQYKDNSAEELRCADYQLGRKGQGMGTQVPVSSSVAPVWASSAFGGTTGGVFSTPAPAAGGCLFGAPAATGTASTFIAMSQRVLTR